MAAISATQGCNGVESEASEAPLITCQVVADLACPFCCIGTAKFVEALDSMGINPALGIAGSRSDGRKLRVELQFVPFFLNPELVLPAEGMEFSDYMREAGKVGDVHNESNASETVVQLRKLASTCKPPLELKCLGEGNKVRPTIDALGAALVIAPRSPGGNLAANATMLALYRSIFEEGADICDPAVLRSVLAVTAPGLSESDLAAVASKDVREELTKMESDARFVHRAQGVPLFRIKIEGVPLPKGRVVCPPGMQQPEAFGRIFDYLLALSDAAPKV